MRTLNQRAAMVIRSLMRDLHVSDHIVFPEGENAISANKVLAELEAQEVEQPAHG